MKLIKVTEEMEAAGELIQKNALLVYRYHHMQIGDVSMEYNQFENADLLESWQKGNMTTSKIVYIAMERAK